MDDIIYRRLELLALHPVYAKLNNIANIRTFMEVHVFAVWDFMSLLKALQRQLTCVEIPWRPSPYGPVATRLINEIVLDEESDHNAGGEPMSHFEMYLESMREIGASTTLVERFIDTQDLSILPAPIAQFVGNNLRIAASGSVHNIAAAFFYGREKVIPAMFERMVQVIERWATPCPSFVFYLKRHIELDGDSHGVLASSCLELLCDDSQKTSEAREMAIQSIHQRSKLWDYTLSSMSAAPGPEFARPNRHLGELR